MHSNSATLMTVPALVVAHSAHCIVDCLFSCLVLASSASADWHGFGFARMSTHVPPRMGAVFRWGLHLRGGKPDDRLVVERPRVSTMITTKHVRGKSAMSETPIEAAAAIVPGITELLPNTLNELQRKKKLRQLSAEEADVYNVLAYEEQKHTGRPRARRVRTDLNATTIASQIDAVESELQALRQMIADGHEPTKIANESEKSLAKLEHKLQLLRQVRREVELKARYATFKEEERDEEGQVVYQIKNQSLWLDALDDARLDDVDAWHLGLHDGPTSRYTSGWDKKNAGATIVLDSKRRVVRGPQPPKDALMGSVRALKPLPPSGVHYLQVVMRGDGGTKGSSLGGGNYIGLVDGNVTNWDGCWELNTAPEETRTEAELEWGSSSVEQLAEDEEGDILLPWTISKSARRRDGSGGVAEARKRRCAQRSRRLHIMALHDACARQEGEVTWASGLRVPWVKGSSFGHGDAVGLLVNMDTRTVNVYKNGRFLGKAFGNLPDEVYPFVCLAQPEVSAELSFPKLQEDDMRRELRQSALWIAHQKGQPPPPPPPVPLKQMARDPVGHRLALAKRLRLKIKELKAEIRLRGTEKGPPHSEGVAGHSLWNFNTLDYWIALHKCRYALFLLGKRRPPESRFINGRGERLVMRGDGEEPPLTEAEDRMQGAARGHLPALQKLLLAAGLMTTGSDGRSAIGPAGVRLLDSTKQPMNVRPEFLIEASGKRGGGPLGQGVGDDSGVGGLSRSGGVGSEEEALGAEKRREGKTYLPWSVYRKEQKKGKIKAPKLRDDDIDEEKKVKERRKRGLPDEDAVLPVWDKSRTSQAAMELPRAHAANNPRRALKETQHLRKESIRRLKPPPRFAP